MTSSDERNYEQQASRLAERFENAIATGEQLFLELDDFELLLEHYIGGEQNDWAQRVVWMAKTQYPNTLQLTILEAELKHRQDRPDEALHLLAKVESLEQGNAGFHLCRASAQSSIGDQKAALASLKLALTCEGADRDLIYFQMGMVYLMLENLKQATVYLKKAAELDSNNRDTLHELMYCFEHSDAKEEALAYFTELTNREPYNAGAWFCLGHTYQWMEQTEQALQAIDYAILIDDHYEMAVFNKALILRKVERLEEAIETFKISLSFALLESLTHYYIADCYENLNDKKLALRHYDISILKNNQMGEAWVGASSMLDDLGRPAEALHYATKAVGIEPDNAEYWCFKAGIEIGNGLLDAGLRSYERALQLGMRDEVLFEDYLYACLLMDNQPLSESVMDQAYVLFPSNELIQLYRGIVQIRRKETKEGLATLLNVLGQNPTLLGELKELEPMAAALPELSELNDRP